MLRNCLGGVYVGFRFVLHFLPPGGPSSMLRLQRLHHMERLRAWRVDMSTLGGGAANPPVSAWRASGHYRTQLMFLHKRTLLCKKIRPVAAGLDVGPCMLTLDVSPCISHACRCCRRSLWTLESFASRHGTPYISSHFNVYYLQLFSRYARQEAEVLRIDPGTSKRRTRRASCRRRPVTSWLWRKLHGDGRLTPPDLHTFRISASLRARRDLKRRNPSDFCTFAPHTASVRP